jgi:hypothetical protein
MNLQCLNCRISLPFLLAGVYRLSSGQLCCQSCYESGAVQLHALSDLLSDPLIYHLRNLIQNLCNSTYDTNSARYIYQQSLRALEMRVQELSEAPEGGTPSGDEVQTDALDDEKWLCPHCQFRNIQTNPICWQCRNAPADAAKPVNATNLDLPMLLTVRAEDKAPSDQWICQRCGIAHLFSEIVCSCGYVNLELVTSSLQNVSEERKAQILEFVPQTVCWTCPCGYEYNLNTAKYCGKCYLVQESEDKTAPVPPVNYQEQVEPSIPMQASSNRRVHHERAAKNALKWKCLTCGRSTSEISNSCSLCGLSRPVKRCDECHTELVNGKCPKLSTHSS